MESTIHNIAVVGTGQIGSRHLQALALSEIPISIQVVDESSEALCAAKNSFLQVNPNGNVKTIEFLNKIDNLNSNLDIVIIATSANVRRKVIEEILQKKKVKYLILEKVLFQKIEDYIFVEKLLDKLQVRAWVNCPRRMWPIYKEIRENLSNSKSVHLNIIGSEIGLGCNGIHFLDLLSYLSNNLNFILKGDLLDNKIIQSKRNGFIEFSGILNGFSSSGCMLTITSLREKGVPLLVQINSEHVQCQLREQEGKALISSSLNNWEWKEIDFTAPYQSQLTHNIIHKLIQTGNCELTTFGESCKLHIPFINILLKHYNTQVDKEVKICPIT